MNDYQKKIKRAAEVIYQLTEIEAVDDFSEVEQMTFAYLNHIGLKYTSTEVLRDEETFYSEINTMAITPQKIEKLLIEHLQEGEDEERPHFDEWRNED